MESEGDDLPARVNAEVDVSLGKKGDQLLELLGDFKSIMEELAIAKQKIEKNGYTVSLDTKDGELVVVLKNENK
jgi:hypothetical protein